MKLSGLDLRQRDGVTCAPSVAVVAGALLGPAYRAALMGPDARDVGAAGRAWFAGERGRVYAQVSRLWPRRLGTTPGGWPAITARSAPFGVRAPPAAGMNGTPYFRPPYGVHNADIDRVAADLGYTTVTMWSGDVGDSVPENETSLVANAGKSFQPQRIVLIHANLPTVTHCYSQLIDLIQSRNLQTVTLNDVFS
jgi:hypothetical protein